MKKSFYFALALTAGLFASCSSDEIAQAPNGGLAVDDNTPVKIEIGKASAGYEITRGTGRVGDATAGNKQWKGQEFTVLMLEKGTMKGAYADLARTTPILKGTNYKTNDVDNNVLSLDPNAIYYPTVDANNQTAVFDFWGFRLDRSETPTAGTPVFNGYDVAAAAAAPAEFTTTTYDAEADFTTALGANVATVVADKDAAEADAALKAIGTYFYKNNTDADASTASTAWWSVNVTAAATGATGNQITVPFKIDGTQDIMVATTSPSDPTYEPAHPGLLYSAKSARAGVVPNMEFKHLLTSLTFKVKPKSSNITKKATNPTTSAQWKPGYTITNIQVKSKATGDLIVAYTGNTEPAERIIWNAGEKWDDPTTLETFELQCRKKEVNDKADIKMEAINKTITTNLPYTNAGYVDMDGNNQFTYTTAAARDAFEVYDSDDLDDETGLPTGNKTTLGAITGTYGYILTYNNTDRVAPYTVAKKYLCEYKATDLGPTSELVPFATKNVTPVVLDWQGTDETAVVITNSAASTKAAFDATAAAKKYTYDGVENVLTLADWQNTLPAATDYIYCDASDADPANHSYTKFDVTTAYQAAVAGANAVTSDPVGEPMLVAPSNDAANSGYVVYVTYKYWKKQTASTVVETTATTNPIIVNNYTSVGGVKVSGAFEAGKNYNVTITLYSDGEVLNGEATSEHWNDGGDLDAGEDD